MRNVLVAGFVALGLLAGCGAQLKDNSIYMYKDRPVSLAQKDKDTFDCKVKAAQAVPTDKYSSVTPTYTSPVYCSSYGYSTSCTGGNTYGGNVITTDVNVSLRREYSNRCMANKGYKTTTFPIPQCDPKKVNTSYSVNSKIHKPVRGACWVLGTPKAALIILPEDQ